MYMEDKKLTALWKILRNSKVVAGWSYKKTPKGLRNLSPPPNKDVDEKVKESF